MAVLNFRCRHRFVSGFELEVAFEIRHRFTSLFGPSGSGKTSVLSMIAGALTPQSGAVRLGDRTLLDTDRACCLRPEQRRIGFVFQDARLFPHMTVAANLRYGIRRRSSRGVDFARVVEVLEIGPLLARSPHHLSGGEKQRVALGRTLLSGPELLLMDEPLASLDEPIKNRILNYLDRAIAEWNIPTLFVTHSQAEVRRAAEWVVVMDKGRVIAVGAPEDALTQPGPLTWTNSTGPVNLLRIARLASADGRITAWVADQEIFLPIAKLPSQPPSFIQFRPADVILSRQDVTGLSVRNHLRGRVCQIAAIGDAVFVAVDIGQILWAEITPHAAQELQLAPNLPITCLLKAHSLKLVA